MLNVDTIKNGLVIDHIRAGSGYKIFTLLGLDKDVCTCALICNVPSKKCGRKDIIKIDNVINLDFSLLGFIDPNITVNTITNGGVTRKKQLSLPPSVENVIRCKNPRCITSTEKYIPHIFVMVDRKRREYRCEYCDALYRAGVGEVF
ncbi:MAG TPA: aspartate carbamoyltransferase regulatory subunit [Treponemataceae bacterium]|nr:aspartate carbamoyltransferase regulatory subunit [Treponemataceae bacterium]